MQYTVLTVTSFVILYVHQHPCVSQKLYITLDICLPAHCNLPQCVLPGNHAARCTEPPSGLLAGAVVFQRLQDKISHEAVGKHPRS